MDFIYPSKLGSLCSFMNNVAKPIRLGGYSNATEMQIQVSYKCTLMLRDTIKPYLLHRTKEGVQSNLRLPAKNEQVCIYTTFSVGKIYIFKQKCRCCFVN